LAAVADKPASLGVPTSLYSFLVWSLPLIIIVYPKVRIKQLRQEFKNGGWKVGLAAFCNAAGFILFIEALNLADASRVIPVICTGSIITVLGGIIFLKERDHIVRKLIAMIIAFCGVVLLA
jgi:drug/metabolite transporter (DMT)-like permease